MVPLIPRNVLKYFLNEGTLTKNDTIVDPFSGSGTVGVEANLAGLHAVLIDINPLACMISKAKTSPLEISTLFQAYKDLFQGFNRFPQPLIEDIKKISQRYRDGVDLKKLRPEVNPQYDWFPEPQLYHLGHLRNRIDGIESIYGRDVARFFRVILSKVCRLTSYQRNHEFKRYRIPEEKRSNHNPDILDLFQNTISKKIGGMTDFSNLNINSATDVYCADSRRIDCVEEDQADAVITSPPYGDHLTTVTYGQFSIDQAVISMGVERDVMKRVDENGLGGLSSDEMFEKSESVKKASATLNDTIRKLEGVNGRANDAIVFFVDFYESMKEMKRILKPGHPLVMVIADRRISQQKIPTHEITIELFRHLDFEFVREIERNIPEKMLPDKNSPGNGKGNPNNTMTDEHILFFENGPKNDGY
jgi:DNA modification methylase